MFTQRSYWCGQSSNVVHVDQNESYFPDYGDRAAFFEPTVSDRNVGIKIRNLTKVSSHYIWSMVIAYNHGRSLYFTSRYYASAVLAMALCPSVRPSVRHKSEFY